MKTRSKSAFALVAATAAAAMTAVTFASCADNTIYDDDYKIMNSESITKSVYSETRHNSSIKIKAKSVTGVDTLFTVEIDGGLTVSYNAELNSGRLKIVVCDYDKVTTVFECTEDSPAASATDEKIELESGMYRIRLVGDSANFELKSFSYTAY